MIIKAASSTHGEDKVLIIETFQSRDKVDISFVVKQTYLDRSSILLVVFWYFVFEYTFLNIWAVDAWSLKSHLYNIKQDLMERYVQLHIVY